MAGIFGDFIDQDVLDDVEVTAGYGQNEDGIYEGVVSSVDPREGTDNVPDGRWIIVEYSLDNGTTENEWFATPQDPYNPTEAEQKKLSFLIRRFGDLGVDRSEIANTDPTDLVGLRVAITLRTTMGKGKNAGRKFQNVTKVSLLDDAPAPEPTPAPAAATRAAGGTRRPNPAARRAA